MPNADVAWIDVLPSAKGFLPRLQAETTPAARTAGTTAGRAFGSSFAASGTQGVEAASTKMSAALRKTADAAGAVRVAEAKLQEVRNSSRATQSQVIAAEERLATARRKETGANHELATATTQVQRAQVQHNEAVTQSNAGLTENTKRAGILTRTFGSMRGAIVGGFAAFYAARAATDFIGGAISAARDLNEEVNKSTVVFGASSGSVLAFAKTAARSLGQSQETALAAAGTFGNLFHAIGITEGASAKMSIKLVTLASDLASFNNADPSDVLEAMRAGLVGETEPMRRFGIDISDASMKAEALKEGLKVGPVLNQAQKAQLAYAIIVKQSGLAQGDFARTSGALANSQRILSAEWTDAKAKMGALLIGPMTAIVHWISGSMIPGFMNLGGYLGKTLGPTFQHIGDTAQVMWSAFMSGVHWLDQNRVALYALVGALVAVRLAMIAHSAQMFIAANGMKAFLLQSTLISGATKAWAAVQWVLNASLMGFPVIWLVAALAAVVTGIVLLWKHSETFRDVVRGVWAAVQGYIQFAWLHVIKPAWDAMAAAAQWLWATVLRPVFTYIGDHWRVILTAMKWAWDNVLHPTFNVLATVATWLWENVLKHVFVAISTAWGIALAVMRDVWNNVLYPMWRLLESVARALYYVILKPIFDLIGIGWKVLLFAMQLYWNTVLHPVFTVIATVAGWLWRTILSPIFTAMGRAWDGLMHAMRTVYDKVLHPMWAIFKNAIDGVRKFLDGGVSAFRTIWNGIKAIFAAPINFVIRTVLRDGLFAAWNWVVNHLGLGKWAIDVKAGYLQGIKGYAVGGSVKGFSPSKTADNIPAMLTAREYVQPVNTVDHYGVQAMDQVRSRDAVIIGKDGTAFGMAGGGQTWKALDAWRRSNLPGSVLTSAYRPGAHDYHGLGQAIDIGVPGNVPSQLAQMANTVAVRWHNANEVIHNPNASIKNGRPTSPPAPWGAATWNAHKDHIHLAVDPTVLAGGPAAGGGIFGSVAEAYDKLKNAIASVSHMSQAPMFGAVRDLPGKLLGGMWDMVKGAVAKAVAPIFTPPQPGDSSPAGTRSAVQYVANERGWGSGANWAALDWIISHESGWRPTAQNPSSSASGLFQQINSTWMANRPIGSSASRMGSAPISEQARAGMKYISDRYGTPISAKAFWLSHGWYNQGGQVFDTGGLWRHGTAGLNLSGGDERVLTPPQDDYFRRFVDAVSHGEGGIGGSKRQMAEHMHFHQGPGESSDEFANRLWHKFRVADRGGVFADGR